jgi:hypothetical protein
MLSLVDTSCLLPPSAAYIPYIYLIYLSPSTYITKCRLAHEVAALRHAVARVVVVFKAALAEELAAPHVGALHRQPFSLHVRRVISSLNLF